MEAGGKQRYWTVGTSRICAMGCSIRVHKCNTDRNAKRKWKKKNVCGYGCKENAREKESVCVCEKERLSCLPDTVLSAEVIGCIRVVVIDTTAGALDDLELSLDGRVAGIAQVTDRWCLVELDALAFGRDALKRRDHRSGQTQVEVHLAGIDRVAAHALEHPTAVGVLLKAAGAALVVKEVREQ